MMTRRVARVEVLAGLLAGAVMLLLDWVTEGHVTASDAFQALLVGAACGYAVHSLRARS